MEDLEEEVLSTLETHRRDPSRMSHAPSFAFRGDSSGVPAHGVGMAAAADPRLQRASDARECDATTRQTVPQSPVHRSELDSTAYSWDDARASMHDIAGTRLAPEVEKNPTDSHWRYLREPSAHDGGSISTVYNRPSTMNPLASRPENPRNLTQHESGVAVAHRAQGLPRNALRPRQRATDVLQQGTSPSGALPHSFSSKSSATDPYTTPENASGAALQQVCKLRRRFCLR